MDTPWKSCISPVQQWMTSDINNPLVSHCFLFKIAQVAHCHYITLYSLLTSRQSPMKTLRKKSTTCSIYKPSIKYTTHISALFHCRWN